MERCPKVGQEIPKEDREMALDRLAHDWDYGTEGRARGGIPDKFVCTQCGAVWRSDELKPLGVCRGKPINRVSIKNLKKEWR